MNSLLAPLILMDHVLSSVSQCTVAHSEFSLAGDYLVGGLFEVHLMDDEGYQVLPEAVNCSQHPFIIPNYRRFQIMRFAVEQINNSTQLLPGVTLGYQIYDQCADIRGFPGIFDIVSCNQSVKPWPEPQGPQGPQTLREPKVLSVIGTYSSTKTSTISPLLAIDLIPLVNYGSSSSSFSEKVKYPTIVRTILPNQQMIEAMVSLLLHFRWHWVALLYSNIEYGIDGRQLFSKRIKKTEICLAYTKEINMLTNHSELIRQIDAQKINVIILFTIEGDASTTLNAALSLKLSKKVWIAPDPWAFNTALIETPNIDSIGTVLGVVQSETKLPGFKDFISKLNDGKARCEEGDGRACNQKCDCNGLRTEEIMNADPSYTFSVYSAVYVVAHALHNLLQCDSGRCLFNLTVYPYMVLAEMKKSNFTLLNETIHFDENADPLFEFYTILFWNNNTAEQVGYYKFHPFVDFHIDSSKILWHTNGEVTTSLCSKDCAVGYFRQQIGIHRCCFVCDICPNGTFLNTTVDYYSCASCMDTEWSPPASTSCQPRLIEFISTEDGAAIVIMAGTVLLNVLSLLTALLFALNYNTPVVRSAGGPMCFLILLCLSLCSISVFFYFGRPQKPFCFMRIFPFVLFYTVVLACFVVRSFQIVSIFKIAASYPSVQRWWMKYHGQWLVIAVAFVLQVLLLLITYTCFPPKLHNETVWYQDQIVLSCDTNIAAFGGSGALCVTLCFLCFLFSYMAKELPKNYNEAKAITFCLLLLILTWIIFCTIFILYRGRHLQTLSALAVLSSLYSFLLWYFLPKCVIILFQPEKNTQQYFQGLIQSYTKTMSQ